MQHCTDDYAAPHHTSFEHNTEFFFQFNVPPDGSTGPKNAKYFGLQRLKVLCLFITLESYLTPWNLKDKFFKVLGVLFLNRMLVNIAFSLMHQPQLHITCEVQKTPG